MSRERAIEVYRQFGRKVRENVGCVIAIGVSDSALLYRVESNASEVREWAQEQKWFDVYLFRIGQDGNLEDEVIDIDPI